MILQLSFFVDFMPFVGLGLLLFGAFLSIEALFLSSQSEISGSVGTVISFVLGVGLVLGVYQVHLSEPLLLVIIFGMAGKYIQGIAAIRLYQKASYAVRNRSLSWGGFDLHTKVVLKIATFFSVLLLGVVVSLLAIVGAIQIPLSEVMIGIWTVFTIAFTVLGLSITLYGAADDYPSYFSTGLVVLVAGSEVYNLGSLSTEILATLALSIAYTVGFWIAAYRFVADEPAIPV